MKRIIGLDIMIHFYINCNNTFNREEQWNEMLTYNSSCEESLNDMICFTSPLNYYNLSKTDKKISSNFQNDTLTNTSALNALKKYQVQSLVFMITMVLYIKMKVL